MKQATKIMQPVIVNGSGKIDEAVREFVRTLFVSEAMARQVFEDDWYS